MNATTKANNEYRERVRKQIATQNAIAAKVTSRRIQKHLVYRDDTMFIHTIDARIYVDTHCDGVGNLYFVMVAWPNKSELIDFEKAETRIIEDVTELERTMKETSGDMRKWRVLKNGG